MMKLAFSALPCEGWSAEKIVSYCKQYGFIGVELREDSSSFASLNRTAEELNSILKLFCEAEIAVTNIGSSICIKGKSEEEIQLALQQFQHLVRLANALLAKGIRIFLGNFAVRHDDPKETLDYGRIIGFLKNACDMAVTHNVEVWVETHNEFATGKSLRKLLDDEGRVPVEKSFSFL